MKSIFLVVFAGLVLGCLARTGCKDLNGADVDYFVMYKMGRPVGDWGGYTYAYWDSNSGSTFKVLDLNDTNAAAYTVNQMYQKNNGVNYVMYNDQTYDTTEQRDKEKTTDHESDGKGGTYAHMKGDIAWDETSGFWLVHSVPGFPLSHKVKFDNYPLPNWVYLRAQALYGQWFYCTTLPTSAFNTIGQLMQFDYPYIYDSFVTAAYRTEMPYINAILSGSYIKGASNITLQSVGGRKYIAFGKNYATNSDLYEDYVAPGLQSGLKTETWCGGLDGFHCMPSDCKGSPITNPSNPQKGQSNYAYDVVNVLKVSFARNLWFSNEYEHSKFALAYNRGATPAQQWVCAGDMNRQTTQRGRGGGALCSVNEDLWSSLDQIISSYDKACEK